MVMVIDWHRREVRRRRKSNRDANRRGGYPNHWRVMVGSRVVLHSFSEILIGLFFGNIIKAQTDPTYTFDGTPRLEWLAIHGLTETGKAVLLPPVKEQ